MSDREKYIQRIKKCLRLAKSSNQHEAAAALRQAQKLMAAHNVSAEEAQAPQINEHYSKGHHPKTPARWMLFLANGIDSAMGVRHFWAGDIKVCNLSFKEFKHLVFVGRESNAQIAAYAFETLLRQLKKERGIYVASLHGRCKPSTKTRKGDAFAIAWIHAVRSQIVALRPDKIERQAIERYFQAQEMSDFKGRDRGIGKGDGGACLAGAAAGINAQLRHAVNGEPKKRITL